MATQKGSRKAAFDVGQQGRITTVSFDNAEKGRHSSVQSGSNLQNRGLVRKRGILKNERSAGKNGYSQGPPDVMNIKKDFDKILQNMKNEQVLL